MLLANTLGCLFLAPILLVNGSQVTQFQPSIWLYLLLTGFWQAWYYLALANAYRSGDLSIAYPLARSFPVIFVTVFTLLAGLKTSLSGWFFSGALLVVAGSLVLPMKRFSDFNLHNYWNKTSLMALAAAVGTAGYSIVDDRALALLRSDLAGIAANTAVTLLYAFLEGISASLWLGVYVLIKKHERMNLSSLLHNGIPGAAAFGFIIFLTYSLVLLAMAYVTDVSYVVAFRQLSIPLGAVLGVLLLKEPGHPPKFLGVGVMFLGLLLVGLG